MATSSRPRRNVNRRSMKEFHEGLLHEEELAIRRALQASLIASKIKTDEIHNNGPSLHHQNIIKLKKEQKNSSNLSDNKIKKTKKKRLKEEGDDTVNDKQHTSVKKKLKLLNDDSVSSRSRSSSVNSSDSINSSSSNSKTVTSASSQTKLKCNKIINAKSPVKSPKKEKLGVKIRKKLMKKKLKAARHVSDCESTMSGSTASEIVTLKKTRRMRKRKNTCNATFVQKKYASLTPSPTKMSLPTFEIDTTVPLAKTKDFLDFLCLRGHPQLSKELEAFSSPCNSPFSDEDFPSSPPSSSLSELPSSPSPSLAMVTSVDSPSCETPTFDTPPTFDDGLHAMRMYAGIENKRKAVDEGTRKEEIAVADMEREEEPFKNGKSVTPPLSFRVSPRPAPPFSNGRNKIIPSPAPLTALSPSANNITHKPSAFYPTPDSPGFGPPPLMLGQGRTSASGDCCSPPPLLYIPAAAQRVTHLHGPPKLERVHPAPDGSASASEEPPLLTRHGCSTTPKGHVEQHNTQASDGRLNSNGSTDISSVMTSRDQMPILEGHPYTARPSSAVDFTKSSKTSAVDFKKDDTNESNSSYYTRNTKSCPLSSTGDRLRLEQAKRDLNAGASDSYRCGVPVARPSSQGINTDSSHVGYNTRSHEACSVASFKQSEINSSPSGRNSLVDLAGVDSPDSNVSLGGNSLLENLQKAHDSVSNLLSPLRSSYKVAQAASPVSMIGNNKLRESPQKHQSFTHSGSINQQSDTINCDSYPSFLREKSPPHGEMPQYPPMPIVSEPFTGQETGNVLQFEPRNREAFTPPWSHLHASYEKPLTPPRPYTLSLNSSYNPSSQKHIIPRTIPLVSTNKVPIIPSNQHISVPFNKEFMCKPPMNQSYGISNTFVNSSPRKDSSNGELVRNVPPSYQRDVYHGNLNETNVVHNSGLYTNSLEHCSIDKDHSVHKQKELSRMSLDPNGEKVHGENLSKSKHGKPQVTDESGLMSESRSTNKNEAKSLSMSKSVTNSEVKKRRGRPPGSKNKKTLAQLEKNNKDKLPNTDTFNKSESDIAKESDGNGAKALSKKKKIGCPILRPTEDEFKDPIGYLKSVKSMLEKFGICIIDPPESWKMESHLPGNPRFTTKRQLIHRLQKRWGPTEIKLACIEKHLQQQQSAFNLTQMPVVGGCDLDLAEVSRIVMEHGGMQKIIDTKKWNKVADLLKIPKSTQDRVGKVQDAYCKYLLSFDLLPESDKTALENEVRKEIDEKGEAEEYRNQCSAKGRSFSMGCFQRTSRNFQDHFFKTDPSVNDIEREYWKIVQSRDKYVTAHHVKLDTREHGSCFPTSKSDPYTKNGWNLNMLAHLKGSILKHAGNVEDLTIPWLNIDMLFSTKRWTTTPLQTYLIDYLHSSNDKVWYGVPESDIDKFPHTKNDNTNDYEDGEFMVSPSNLSRETGLNVTRLEQKQGQFVVVAPRVFHCYVSSGYSVSETVSFAFSDWLSTSSTREADAFVNWPGFSYDKLLLKSIEEVCNAGKESLECLHRELVQIRDTEVALRKELKELGVTECKPTSTTGKGVQTIKTAEGSIQVNATSMSCVVCNRLCHLSSVLSKEDSEILCLSDAVNYIRNEKPSETFTIVTNCPVSQLEEAISSVTKKLKNLT